MLHYIILFLALTVTYLVQKNRKLLKHILEVTENSRNKEKNMFDKRENHRVKQGLNTETFALDKDIIVYDDWTKELQLVVFNKNADNFPFLVTVKEDVNLEEATKLFKNMKAHYNKGGRLYVISDGENQKQD